MLLVQLPSVLYDVCCPVGLFLKKQKQAKSPKPLARVYICTTYFYLILYQPYFCSTFQIKYVDLFKA